MSASGHIRFLLKHSTIYGIGNILAKIVGFLLLPLYTSYLSPASFGVLELVDVTTGMIAIVIGIGITEALSRFYYDQEGDAGKRLVISTGYIVVAATSAVTVLLLSFYSEFFAQFILGSREYGRLFTIAFISLGLGIVTDIAQVYFRLLHRSMSFITVSLLNLVVGVVLNVLFVAYLEYGVIGIFYASLITKILIGVPVTALVLRKVGFGFSRALAGQMVAFSTPLIPSSLASTAVAYSDRYFINVFLTLSDTGIYGLGRKIGSMLHMLITVPFLLVFLPRRFEIAGDRLAREVFARAFYYYVLVMLFAGLALSILADVIMLLMTTAEFYPAGDLVPLAALSMIILGLKYHFEFGILYSKKTHYYLYINAASAVLHLLLNWVLVARLGVWGAMYASFIAYLFTTSLLYVVGQRLFPVDYKLSKSLQSLAVAVCLFYVSRIPIEAHFAGMLAYKLVLILCFPILIYALGLVSKGEVHQGKRLAAEFGGRLWK